MKYFVELTLTPDNEEFDPKSKPLIKKHIKKIFSTTKTKIEYLPAPRDVLFKVKIECADLFEITADLYEAFRVNQNFNYIFEKIDWGKLTLEKMNKKFEYYNIINEYRFTRNTDRNSYDIRCLAGEFFELQNQMLEAGIIYINPDTGEDDQEFLSSPIADNLTKVFMIFEQMGVVKSRDMRNTYNYKNNIPKNFH